MFLKLNASHTREIRKMACNKLKIEKDAFKGHNFANNYVRLTTCKNITNNQKHHFDLMFSLDLVTAV